MTKTYTKRDREKAILICAIGASTPSDAESYRSIARDLGLNGEPVSWTRPGYDFVDPALTLAFYAWSKCQHDDLPDAAAAQLLREGWTP